MDLFGMTHLVPGHRSSLLASNGIASFAVAYVGHEGLSNGPHDMDLSYFLRAYDWLSQHPSVNPEAMGGVGSCIGGGYTSIVAWKRPSMKCFVGLNSTIRPTGPTQEVEGELLEKEVDWPMERMVEIDGAISWRPLCTPEDDLKPLPYWRHGIKVLHIQGSDDQCVDPEVLPTSYERHVPDKFKGNFEFICYPGAGHIIEPPFMPLCRTNYNSIFKLFFLWGGQPKQHAHAQMESWPRIVAFLKKHLMQDMAKESQSQTVI